MVDMPTKIIIITTVYYVASRCTFYTQVEINAGLWSRALTMHVIFILILCFCSHIDCRLNTSCHYIHFHIKCIWILMFNLFTHVWYDLRSNNFLKVLCKSVGGWNAKVLSYEVKWEKNCQMVSQKPKYCKRFEINSHWRKLSMIMVWERYCNASPKPDFFIFFYFHSYLSWYESVWI